MIRRALVAALVACVFHCAGPIARAESPRDYARACIAAAEGALLVNDTGLAREWLRRTPPAERALEWRLLWTETDRSLGVFARLPAAVNDVAVEPDWTWVLTACADGGVRLHEQAPASEPRRLAQHRGEAYAVCVHPDGSLIASSGADSTVRSWSPESERARAWRAHGGGVWGLAMGTSRDVVTASTDDTGAVWDLFLASVVGVPRRVRAVGGHVRGAASAVMVRGGGWWIAGANDGSVRRVLSRRGEALTRYEGHVGPVPALALSHDGLRLLTAGNDGTVRVFATEGGESLHVFRPGAGRAVSAAVTFDAKIAAAGFVDGTVRLFDLERGVESARLVGPGTAVTAVAFDPRGEVVVAATERGGMRAWSIHDGRELATLHGHQGATYGLCFTTEGSRLVSASYDRTVRLWDPHDWALVGTLRDSPTELYGVAISPDGQRMIVGRTDGWVQIYDLGTSSKEER